MLRVYRVTSLLFFSFRHSRDHEGKKIWVENLEKAGKNGRDSEVFIYVTLTINKQIYSELRLRSGDIPLPDGQLQIGKTPDINLLS